MEIIIGKPYIRPMEERNSSLLCSDLEGIGKPFTLWYEVDERYAQYLCTERADAFLIGLLPYAMAHSLEGDPLVVKCKAPISEQLYYQLHSHYIPTLVKCIGWYHNIEIKCELDSKKLESKNAVGAGVSGGVDSWYTLLKSKRCNSQKYQISHGAYFEFDPNGIFDGELQNKMREMARNVCSLNNIAFVNIKSNICKDIYRIPHGAIITWMFFSYAGALQKLFSIFYTSSTHSYKSFKIIGDRSERYKLLNVHCLSNENITFYTPGSDMTRHERTSYIADYDFPRKILVVCNLPRVEKGILQNCSKCSKCTQTMIDLDLADKLDYFRDVFDVKAYRDNPNYYLGYLSFKGKKDPFVKETLEKFKEYNRAFPFGARIAGFFKWVNHGFKRGNPLRYIYRP